MDYNQYMFDREQKKAYKIFTRTALIDMVVRKNKEIAELHCKIKQLQPPVFKISVEDNYRYTCLCARETLFPNKSIEEVETIIENNLRDEKNKRG